MEKIDAMAHKWNIGNQKIVYTIINLIIFLIL